MLIYLLTIISFYDLAISGTPCEFDGLQLTAGSATYSLTAGDTCTMSTEASVVGSGPTTSSKFTCSLLIAQPIISLLVLFFVHQSSPSTLPSPDIDSHCCALCS